MCSNRGLRPDNSKTLMVSRKITNYKAQIFPLLNPVSNRSRITPSCKTIIMSIVCIEGEVRGRVCFQISNITL